MKKKTKLTLDHQNLVRRYLLWAYKSTKEDFERIERKTTQLAVDDYILEHLNGIKADIPTEFKTYVADKRKDELKLKYAGQGKKALNPQYVYLKNRLAAIKAAVVHFLGEKELKHIEKLYEAEFTRRIQEARDH